MCLHKLKAILAMSLQPIPISKDGHPTTLSSHLTADSPSARIPSHVTDIDASCEPFLFEAGTAFLGPDTLFGRLDQPAPNATACCRLCATTEPCTHWTYLDGRCRIMHGHLRQTTPLSSERVLSGRVALDLRVPRLAIAAWEDGGAGGPASGRSPGADAVAAAHCEWDPLDAEALRSGSAR